MLRVAINRLVFAEHSVEDAGRFLVINFSLLSKVDTADPLVFDLFEGRFDLHEGSQFVEEVPEHLVLAI